MTTRLNSSFLATIVLLCGFKPRRMVGAQAGLLLIGLRGDDFTAADLPAELGGKHLSGAAVGALISEGLLVVVARIKSPNPNAKGRKLDVLRIACPQKAKAWLRANDVQEPTANPQPELLLA